MLLEGKKNLNINYFTLKSVTVKINFIKSGYGSLFLHGEFKNKLGMNLKKFAHKATNVVLISVNKLEMSLYKKNEYLKIMRQLSPK